MSWSFLVLSRERSRDGTPHVSLGQESGLVGRLQGKTPVLRDQKLSNLLGQKQVTMKLCDCPQHWVLQDPAALV